MELDTSILGSIIRQDLLAEKHNPEPQVPSQELSVAADPSTFVPESTRIPVEIVSDTPASICTDTRSRISATSSTTIPETSLRHSSRRRPLPVAAIANIEEAENKETEGDQLRYREALSQSCSQEWKKAMQDEYASLLQNHT